MSRQRKYYRVLLDVSLCVMNAVGFRPNTDYQLYTRFGLHNTNNEVRFGFVFVKCVS